MSNTFNTENDSVESEVFFYFDKWGNKLVTPNEEFAAVRSRHYGKDTYYRM